MTTRIGAMFAGAGGIELGLAQVIDCELAWFVENDPGASKILARHWPHVPNHGDVTKVDWDNVEPVDILTAGFPCQPVSYAGKRLGCLDERWLWDDVARAVRDLRPSLVALENVRGLLTAGSGRLFGRVLGDLADLGYDARWYGLRAADVGAAHNRFRVFVFAAPADTEGGRLGSRGSGSGWRLAEEPAESGERAVALLPTPRATDGTKGGPNQRGTSGDLMLPSVVHLLPTPAVNDMGAGKTVEQWDAWTEKMQAKHGNGNGHGPSLAIEAARLLPTPTSRDWKDSAVRSPWAQYEAAIRRHEQMLGRPAPAPTEPGRNGPRLSRAFVEWLMMLPEGHVTDPRIGLTRNEQLRMLGNGVVPNQCAAALRAYLHDESSTTVTTCHPPTRYSSSARPSA